MTQTIAIKGDIITPMERFPGSIIVREGKIQGLTQEHVEVDIVIDVGKGIIAPGFMDLHVHGGNGEDIMDHKNWNIDKLSKFLAAGGVTSFLPTTITAPQEEILSVARRVAECSRNKCPGAEILGLHIEGPYVNPERAGAQSESQVRPIDMFELGEIYKASKKSLRIVTLAPELTGALDAISWLNERDILVAGGHSNATFDETNNGIMAGMRHATHLFNGMRILHHREPGIVGATLYDDRVTVELIADNFHIHPAMTKIVVKIKSVNKTSLVSDSIVAAGLPDGKYEFGGMKITVSQGKSFLKSGILAGSTIRLCDAVKNMVQRNGFSLQNAVEMASSTPAKIIGLSHRKGYLAPGMDADITVLDQNLSAVLTMVQGKIVHRRSLYEYP